VRVGYSHQLIRLKASGFSEVHVLLRVGICVAQKRRRAAAVDIYWLVQIIVPGKL
jgi:hypothetical protein